jgi:type III secretory pathway component EscS
MFQQPWYFLLLSALPILLAHLAGAIVAVVLLVRQKQKSTPAILALIGFGLLFILDLADFGRDPLIGWLGRRAVRQFWTINTGIGCCCGIFDVAAAVCLIVALWQAIAGVKVPEDIEALE